MGIVERMCAELDAEAAEAKDALRRRRWAENARAMSDEQLGALTDPANEADVPLPEFQVAMAEVIRHRDGGLREHPAEPGRTGTEGP